MTLGACDFVSRLLNGVLVAKIPSCVAFIHGSGLLIMSVSVGLLTVSRSIEMFVIISGLTGVGIGTCISFN